MIRTLVASIAALALLLATPPARADDVALAKAHLRRGAELYRAGKWRAAIVEFEAAYRAKPHGAIHFNVAQCRERLSEWPGALRAYSDYLREVPGAKDRAAVRAAIGKIEGRLAVAGVQALLVYSDPPGAVVTIDGRPRGTTPFHVVLPPGTYALSLSLDGYEVVKEEVVLRARPSRTVDVVLQAAPPQAVAGAPAAATATGAVAPTPSRIPLPPPPDLRARAPMPSAADAMKTPAPRPEQPEKRRVYTWIAAGTAVAAAAAGGYFGLAARRDSDAIRSLSAPDGDEARRLASSAQSKARTANILYAAGGVAAAAGVTLFFVERRF